MARSTDASLEHIRATGSSPSILAGSPEAEDDCGLYADPYNQNTWIYIGNHEEMHVWQKPDTSSTGKKKTKQIERFVNTK